MAGRRGGGAIRPLGIVLSALAALGLLSACADEKGAQSTTTSTTTSEPTTTTASSDQEVLDAYIAFWNDGYLEAADPMDPTNPALAAHATGEQLETLERAFLARQTSGEVIRGTLDLQPRVVSVVGETARVRDCYLDDTGVFDAATGERRDTATGVRHLITATLIVEDDTPGPDRQAGLPGSYVAVRKPVTTSATNSALRTRLDFTTRRIASDTRTPPPRSTTTGA